MINARAETILDRPAYRDAFRTRRCLVLADGFFEWEPSATIKQPWWITRADGAPFAFAGLWATWRGPDDALLRTCTIVTTRAAPSLAQLHDRMPVILEPGAEQLWLDGAAAPGELEELLAPLPDAELAKRMVGSAVNDARYDGADCLEPPGPEAMPATLF
jgi:putative SOS response-associated peptidase YedK